jgi:soluble lytic murein transglycosylase-like protein
MQLIKILMILFCIKAQNTYASDDLFNKCFDFASARYGIDSKILKSISIVESGSDHTAISETNTNRTHDIGLMQINSSWLPALVNFGIDESDLMDPCTNIQVGAWVLAQEIRRFGYSWDAIGAYNAGPSKSREKLRKVYAAKVKKVFLAD